MDTNQSEDLAKDLDTGTAVRETAMALFDGWDVLPGNATSNAGKDPSVKNPFVVPFLCASAPSDGISCPTVLVIPGGGYQRISEPREGVDVAVRLQKMNFSAFILHYRVPADTPESGRYDNWAPPIDVQRAIRLIRANADVWPGRINAASLGMVAFSAGGAIAQIAAARHSYAFYSPVDDVDNYSARPDFMVLMYPGGTNTTLYSKTSHDSIVSPDGYLTLPVSDDPPPTFIGVARDDNVTGVEGALALHRALVKVEGEGTLDSESETWVSALKATSLNASSSGSHHWMVIFEEKGLGHGFGVCDDHGRAHGVGCSSSEGCLSSACQWPYSVMGWLRGLGYVN